MSGTASDYARSGFVPSEIPRMPSKQQLRKPRPDLSIVGIASYQLETFVATEGGRDVGLVRGMRHDHFGDAGYLISLWVAPEARRHGIGSALIDAVALWGKTQGFNRLLLDVGETLPSEQRRRSLLSWSLLPTR